MGVDFRFDSIRSDNSICYSKGKAAGPGQNSCPVVERACFCRYGKRFGVRNRWFLKLGRRGEKSGYFEENEVVEKLEGELGRQVRNEIEVLRRVSPIRMQNFSVVRPLSI